VPPPLTLWVRDDFDVALVHLDLVYGGVDEHAQVWRGRDDTGRDYAVKLTAGGTDAGLALPSYLVERGVPGVATPIRTQSGAIWGDHDAHRLTLTPWLGEHRAIEVGLNLEQWQTFGTILAHLHATPPPDSVTLPAQQHHHDAVTDVVDQVWARIADPGPFDDISAEVCASWRAAERGISMMAQEADRLAPLLRERRAPTVVCHADPHIGNVIVDASDAVWLIDWDDAVTAPCELDLMFVVDGGILASNPVTDAECDAFFAGYGSVRLDPERLRYYQCVRALVDVGDFSLWALDAQRQTADRQEALDIVRLGLSESSLVARALRRTGPPGDD
jgi:spectinomycin phosphotransferase